MPYHLELGSEGRSFHGKAIVVNSQTGEHKSNEPIDMEKAKAQMRILEGVASEESAPKKRRILLKKKPVAPEAPKAPEEPKKRRVLLKKKPKAPEPPKAQEAPKASDPLKEKHKFLYDMTMDLVNLAPSTRRPNGDYIFPREKVQVLIGKLSDKGYKKEAIALRQIEMYMPLGRGKPTVKSVTKAYKPIIAFLKSLTLG